MEENTQTVNTTDVVDAGVTAEETSSNSEQTPTNDQPESEVVTSPEKDVNPQDNNDGEGSAAVEEPVSDKANKRFQYLANQLRQAQEEKAMLQQQLSLNQLNGSYQPNYNDPYQQPMVDPIASRLELLEYRLAQNDHQSVVNQRESKVNEILNAEPVFNKDSSEYSPVIENFFYELVYDKGEDPKSAHTKVKEFIDAVKSKAVARTQAQISNKQSLNTKPSVDTKPEPDVSKMSAAEYKTYLISKGLG